MSTNTRDNTNRVDAKLARNGGLSYIEIPAVDVRRSVAFYENVFGWNIGDLENDEPKFSDQSGYLIGRWVKGPAILREPGLPLYFYVDHINDAVQRATAGGGQIIKTVYPEGNLFVAVIRDPAGNVIGLWQDAGQ